MARRTIQVTFCVFCVDGISKLHRGLHRLGWAESEALRIVSADLDRIERLSIELIDRIELPDAVEILKLIEGVWALAACPLRSDGRHPQAPADHES
jgi:hypothetical protein